MPDPEVEHHLGSVNVVGARGRGWGRGLQPAAGGVFLASSSAFFWLAAAFRRFCSASAALASASKRALSSGLPSICASLARSRSRLVLYDQALGFSLFCSMARLTRSRPRSTHCIALLKSSGFLGFTYSTTIPL